MSRSQWLNSDENFENILGEDSTYNFNDPDSDGDGLIDGYELGVIPDNKIISNDVLPSMKKIIEGDSDNDRQIDSGENWLDLNPLNYDSDGDELPDGHIDGWVIDSNGMGSLIKTKQNKKIDPWEGDGIEVAFRQITPKIDVVISIFPGRAQIVNQGTKVDSDSDGLPDLIEKLNYLPTDDNDADGDGIIDGEDVEPYSPKRIDIALSIKSYYVMDHSVDMNEKEGSSVGAAIGYFVGGVLGGPGGSAVGGAVGGIIGYYIGKKHAPGDIYFKAKIMSREEIGKPWTTLEDWKTYPDNNDGCWKDDNFKGWESDEKLPVIVADNIPDKHYQLLFILEMYDKDLVFDDKIDMSPIYGTGTLKILYNIRTGLWAVWKDMSYTKLDDPDYLKDSDNLLEGSYVYEDTPGQYKRITEGENNVGVGDGKGYVSGWEPNLEEDFIECGGIQFDIATYEYRNSLDVQKVFCNFTDYDLDGFPTISELFWQEHFYPTLKAVLWDSDNDMIPDGWEIRYNFDPTKDDFSSSSDKDNDGIKDINEFYLDPNNAYSRTWYYMSNSIGITGYEGLMYRWGAQPDRKDIFVEVDWMKGHKPSRKALELVILSFYRACRLNIFITLHIDDGCMGGGGSLGKHDSKFTDSVESALYANNNYGSGSNTGFDKSSRSGIFHYCVFADKNKDGSSTSTGFGQYGGDFFVIFDGTFSGSSNQANTFMHEMGHNILGAYIEFSDSSWSGVDPETYRSWHNPLLSHFKTGHPTGHDLDGDGKNDVYDHSPSKSDTMYYITTRDTIDYKSETWAAIDLVECFN